MTEVVHVEPPLQPLTSEMFLNATVISDGGARLDIVANGFWGGCSERAFFDVRVFNPYARPLRQPLPTCYKKHENQTKGAYEQIVRDVECSSFTPLVMSLTGGLGNASVCYKCLTSLIAAVSYSCTMRCSLSFSLFNPAHLGSTIGHAVMQSHSQSLFWTLFPLRLGSPLINFELVYFGLVHLIYFVLPTLYKYVHSVTLHPKS